jgi:hypothetical protein
MSLATAAGAEYTARERFYPEDVRAGAMSAADANHDWLCWKSISEWLLDMSRGPKLSEWDLSWDDLLAAARRALARREDALASATDQSRAVLERRRDAIASILKLIERQAEFIRSLNEQLRREAAERRAAKQRDSA